MHPSNYCEQQQATMVKPQPSCCDDTFIVLGITAPSFSLGAWGGDKTAQVSPDEGPTFVFPMSCRDPDWDDDDDHDGDDDSEFLVEILTTDGVMRRRIPPNPVGIFGRPAVSKD